MGKDPVIFVEEGRGGYERLGGGGGERWVRLLLVTPTELPRRIATAFLPPLPGSPRVYVDLVGPLLAVSLLACVLHLGQARKELLATPSTALLVYLLSCPCVVVLGARLGRSRLSPVQVLSLLGYALYGPLLTLTVGLLVPDAFFFPLLFLFAGSTAFRMAVVLLLTIPSPAARLLLCSLVSISHLLFTIFSHFAFIHKTFVYGRKTLHH